MFFFHTVFREISQFSEAWKSKFLKCFHAFRTGWKKYRFSPNTFPIFPGKKNGNFDLWRNARGWFSDTHDTEFLARQPTNQRENWSIAPELSGKIDRGRSPRSTGEQCTKHFRRERIRRRTFLWKRVEIAVNERRGPGAPLKVRARRNAK